MWSHLYHFSGIRATCCSTFLRIFHFLISQAVDQGGKHGGDKVIQDLNSCIKPGVRGGLQVDENHWHKGEEDGSEVGAAGGEGTALAFSRSDLKNGANDATVGGEDEKEAAEGHETHTDEPHHLQGQGVCTSQLQHPWDIPRISLGYRRSNSLPHWDHSRATGR